MIEVPTSTTKSSSYQPIISISGIRGILGQTLTLHSILKFTSAFADFTNNGAIVVGRDGRQYGDFIEKLVISVLLLKKCKVISLGIVPTPTITLAVETLKANGGIAITASHNPQEWNGLKLINDKGLFLNKKENLKFIKFLDLNNGIFIDKKPTEKVSNQNDFYKYHIDKVLCIPFLDIEKIKSRGFKTVVDCVNASGSFIIPELLKRLNCEVIKVNCDGSGIFPRNPEPLPDNLKQTCLLVNKYKADFGFVVDPDADRLVVISDKGVPIGEEYTIVISIINALKNTIPSKRIAVVNLSTTRATDDVVNLMSGKLFKTPVGEVNVIEKMKQEHAVIGGEGSGGVILPSVHYSRDSLVGIALLLNEFADSGLKLSKYIRTLPKYFIKKDKVNIKNINADQFINLLRKKYKNYTQNLDDGLRVDLEDSWFNIRKSNTEPILRIITEAMSEQSAIALLRKVKFGRVYTR